VVDSEVGSEVGKVSSPDPESEVVSSLEVGVGVGVGDSVGPRE